MSLCGIYAPIFQWLVHHCPGSCTSSVIGPPSGGFTSLHGDAEAACSDGGRKGWQRI